MKIGLVCRHFLATKGGLEKYTLALSTELARRGHEIHVFANTGEKRPDVHLHHIPLFPLTSPGKNLSFAYMASQRISSFRLDVVQSMERIWDQDIFRASDGINPIQMAERYPNPFIRQFKSMTPRRQALTYLEKRIFCKNGARFIMTNSNLIKEQICRHYGVSEDRIRVIYNSVDHQRFNISVKERFRTTVRNQYGIGQHDPVILFAGNDFQRKGLDILLKALALLQQKKIRLMVAGHDRTDVYQRWANNNGIGDLIMFLGHQENLEGLYAAADLLILPTRYDAFANVCLEAMACGTPVITTNTNGAYEIIDHGINGFVMTSWEPAELAARIQDFLSVSDRDAMIERTAHKTESFTMNQYMDELFSLYDQVLKEKNRCLSVPEL
jgi:UDP-glucose:(heptosyl)LPS alpha-1,3-glucosyltransferase